MNFNDMTIDELEALTGTINEKLATLRQQQSAITKIAELVEQHSITLAQIAAHVFKHKNGKRLIAIHPDGREFLGGRWPLWIRDATVEQRISYYAAAGNVYIEEAKPDNVYIEEAKPDEEQFPF